MERSSQAAANGVLPQALVLFQLQPRVKPWQLNYYKINSYLCRNYLRYRQIFPIFLEYKEAAENAAKP